MHTARAWWYLTPKKKINNIYWCLLVRWGYQQTRVDLVEFFWCNPDTSMMMAGHPPPRPCAFAPCRHPPPNTFPPVLTFGVDCSQVASAVGSTLSSTWSTVSGTASRPLRSTSIGCWQMAAARRLTSGECSVALNISTCIIEANTHKNTHRRPPPMLPAAQHASLALACLSKHTHTHALRVLEKNHAPK